MIILRWLKQIVAVLLLVYAGLSFFLVPQGWSGVREWLFLTVFMTFVFAFLYTWSQNKREHLLREAPLPQFLKRKVRQVYPHLSGKDLDLVERGLRQFFLTCQRSNKKFVAMPSRVVDAMWHEFILHTKGYKEWCLMGFGWFLHHTPAETLGQNAGSNDGLRRAWYWSCKDEGIDPSHPIRLPLLFALDAKLHIEDGFNYAPDCADINQKNAIGGVYCGADFSSGNFSGDSETFGGSAPSKDTNSNSTYGDFIDGSSDGCSGSSCGGGD